MNRFSGRSFGRSLDVFLGTYFILIMENWYFSSLDGWLFLWSKFRFSFFLIVRVSNGLGTRSVLKCLCFFENCSKGFCFSLKTLYWQLIWRMSQVDWAYPYLSISWFLLSRMLLIAWVYNFILTVLTLGNSCFSKILLTYFPIQFFSLVLFTATFPTAWIPPYRLSFSFPLIMWVAQRLLFWHDQQIGELKMFNALQKSTEKHKW